MLLTWLGVNEAFLPWFVGFRFGEADHPGFDQWYSDGTKAWSARADPVIQFYLCNDSSVVDYADTGASVRISGCAREVDNLKESSLTWGGAAAAARPVDFEGDYRYFVLQDDGNVGFKYVWSLIVKDFGNLELSSISQLNEMNLGFDSPPGLVAREALDGNIPHFYRVNGNQRVIVASCYRGSNGLPVVPRLSTHTAAQMVFSGKRLVDLATGAPLEWDVVFPHLPLAELAARPNLQPDSPLSVAQLASAMGLIGESNGDDAKFIDLSKLSAEQINGLFDAAMREGDLSTAFKLLKGKEREVQRTYARLLHPAPAKFESWLRGSVGHRLSPGDSGLVRQSLARWRSCLTASRRVRHTAHTPRVAGTSWSLDIHTWPLLSSPHGYRYAAVFVERTHRWLYVHFMQKKDQLLEALESLRRYVAVNMAARGVRLEHVWSDEEGSLLTEISDQWQSDNGVKVEGVPKDQHWRNSSVEQSQFQLEQLTNIAMKFSGLPRSYWPFAYAHAVYVLNRRPCSALISKDGREMSPFESMFGKVPDISDLRTFGCPVVTLSKDRTKVDDRGEMGVYLGKAADSPFRILDSPNADLVYTGRSGRIPASADVHYDEDFDWRSLVFEHVFGDIGEFDDGPTTESGQEPDSQSEVLPFPVEMPFDPALDLDDGEFVLDDAGNRVSHADGAPLRGEKSQWRPRMRVSKKRSPSRMINSGILAPMLEKNLPFKYDAINPKRPGTKSWDRYERYKAAVDWRSFRSLGGLVDDLRWDLARGFVRFNDPLFQQQLGLSVSLFAEHDPHFCSFYTGYGGDPMPDQRNRDSPFYLCGYSSLSNKFEAKALELALHIDTVNLDCVFKASVKDAVDLGDIKLVDDPRFQVTLDVKELAETEPSRRQVVYDSIVKEIRQLIDLGTFEWDWLKPGARPLSSRLVLKTKYHADGSFDKEKCRLTIRGCFQVAGRDFDNTYAPTAKAVSGRLLDAVKVIRRFWAKQADISNAFCQADIDMDVFIDLPRGIEIRDPLVASADSRGSIRKRALRLRRALYGLRQSPRLWWADLRSSLLSASFEQCRFDPCIFYKWSADKSKVVYVLCYVDDLKAIGNYDEGLADLEKVLKLRYGLESFGKLSSFLGMNYTELDDGALVIEMKAKIAEMLGSIPYEFRASRVAFDDSLSRIKTGLKRDNLDSYEREVLMEDLSPLEKYLLKNYSSVVGMVGWPAKMCRPDFAQAYSMLSRNLASPGPVDARFLSKLMSYAHSSRDSAMVMSFDNPDPAIDFSDLRVKLKLVGYSDSNYADKLDARWRATTGFCWFLETICVSWRAKRQDVTADSTFKAEMLAAHAAFVEGAWLRDLCVELRLIDEKEPSRFWCDNKSTIFCLCSETMSWKQSHLATKFFACADKIDEGYFLPDHVDGADNPADMFTKGLPAGPLEKHSWTVGLRRLAKSAYVAVRRARFCMADLLSSFATF